MAELTTIARPYATAVFRFAEQGNLAAWSELLFEFAQLVDLDDVLAFVRNPRVSSQQIIELFLSAVKSPVSEEAKNFISVLAENDRIDLLPEIYVQFQQLKNAAMSSADLQITSAFALSDEQVAELTQVLQKKFGRTLHPSVVVDPSLIGGVCAVVGDEVLDMSVRAKLHHMQTTLTF